MAWIERHDQFHDLLCQLSKRDRLCVEARRLRFALQPYLRLFTKLNKEPELKGHEHERILEEIRSRNGKRAEAVTRAHVMANAHSIAECLRVARAEAVPETPVKTSRKRAVETTTAKAAPHRPKKSAA